MSKCDFNKVAKHQNHINNSIEVTLGYEYSPVNLLHFFRTPFSKNTSGRLLLHHGSNSKIVSSCYFNFKKYI